MAATDHWKVSHVNPALSCHQAKQYGCPYAHNQQQSNSVNHKTYQEGSGHPTHYNGRRLLDAGSHTSPSTRRAHHHEPFRTSTLPHDSQWSFRESEEPCNLLGFTGNPLSIEHSVHHLQHTHHAGSTGESGLPTKWCACPVGRAANPTCAPHRQLISLHIYFYNMF